MLNMVIFSTLSSVLKESKRKAGQRYRCTTCVSHIFLLFWEHMCTYHHIQIINQKNLHRTFAQIQYLGRKNKGSHTASGVSKALLTWILIESVIQTVPDKCPQWLISLNYMNQDTISLSLTEREMVSCPFHAVIFILCALDCQLWKKLILQPSWCQQREPKDKLQSCMPHLAWEWELFAGVGGCSRMSITWKKDSSENNCRKSAKMT